MKFSKEKYTFSVLKLCRLCFQIYFQFNGNSIRPEGVKKNLLLKLLLYDYTSFILFTEKIGCFRINGISRIGKLIFAYNCDDLLFK